MIPTVRDWAQTDIGTVRRHNEDAYLIRSDLGLWAVADGAGGHQSGDLAASMIVAGLERLPAELTANEMLSAVRQAVTETHQALIEEAGRRGKGTTIASTVVALVLRNSHFACLWAGDSRAYLLRDGELMRISRDHSLVQELVDAGRLTAAEAEHHPQSNIITRAVGVDDGALDLEKTIGEARKGDRFLLCSDGLSKTVPESEIAALLGRDQHVSPATLLIEAALARRTDDNATAVVVEITG